jgi:hypothetical protein
MKITLMILFVYSPTFADEKPQPLPSAPPPAEGFLLYQPTSNEKQDTYQYLNKQDDPNLSMNKNAENYESGKSRATQMVNMLQNKELTKAFQKITESSNKTMDENPELKSPLGVIIGAASFWYGQTINLIKNEDVRFSARLEGRERRSEFSMASPLLNGQLKFDPNEGMGLGFNRKITSLQTEAAVQYNSKNQVFSTEVRQKLSPNIDLTFGASRLDQNTKIEYRINF